MKTKKLISLLLILLFSLAHFSSFIFAFAQEDSSIHINEPYDILSDLEQKRIVTEEIFGDKEYSSNLVEYDSFLISYFDNITYNFGANLKGSCGYVALGMLLSYYDSFLNDTIIPEQYDVNSFGYDSNMIERRDSPGIMKDIICDPLGTTSPTYVNTLSSSDYFLKISELSNVSLHAKLATIAADLGYYDFNSSHPLGSNLEVRNLVLNSYLQDYLDFTDSDYQFSFTYTNVRDYAINKVLEGTPVILSLSTNDGNRHAVVAYDYDSNLDRLYCHWGCSADKTHVTPESQNFVNYISAFSMQWNLRHSHSNNYAVVSINDNIPTTNFFCYANPSITTYNHTHNYTFSYEKFNSEQHKNICNCGEYILSAHNLATTNHTCVDCAYTSSHTYDSIKIYNKTSHKKVCTCGSYILEYHVVKSTNLTKCIICNGIADSNSTVILSQRPRLYTLNGSFVLSNGIIVLVEEDITSYFDGTLQFFLQNEII